MLNASLNKRFPSFLPSQRSGVRTQTLPALRRKEGNVLFNDAFNTFYLRLYGVGHMVKNHSDSERGNPLPPLSQYTPFHRQDSTYHGLCYTSRGALAGTRKSSMGPPMKDLSDDPSHHERTLLPRSYISLLTTYRTMSERSYHGATSRSLQPIAP